MPGGHDVAHRQLRIEDSPRGGCACAPVGAPVAILAASPLVDGSQLPVQMTLGPLLDLRARAHDDGLLDAPGYVNAVDS